MERFLDIRIYLIRLLLLAFASSSLTACSGLKSLLGSSNEDFADSFSQSFNYNLKVSGLSSQQADFVSAQSSALAGGGAHKAIRTKVGAFSFTSEQQFEIDSISGALRAVADDEHFPTTLDKTNAIEAIASAHLKTLSEHTDSTTLEEVVAGVSQLVGAEITRTGLSGADLIEGLKSHGRGVAQVLISGDFENAVSSELMGASAKGMMIGLQGNTTLSATADSLVALVALGAATEIGASEGDSELLSGILTKMIEGFNAGLAACPDLNAGNRTDYLKEISDSIRSAIASSPRGELNEHVSDAMSSALFSDATELHIVTVYETRDAPYDPDTLSPLHVDGTPTVHIADGTKPIVLVLSSYEGNNWHLTGATSRIQKVVLYGFYDQAVDLADQSLVHAYSVESDGLTYGDHCGIDASLEWASDTSTPLTQAFAICMRDREKFQITSMSGAYQQSSFEIGPGLNSPPKFLAYSLETPWAYASDTVMRGYDEDTDGNLFNILTLTSPDHDDLTLKATIEHTSTNAADFTETEVEVFFPRGAIYGYLLIPFAQDLFDEGGVEHFRVRITSADNVNIVTPTVDGELLDHR